MAVRIHTQRRRALRNRKNRRKMRSLMMKNQRFLALIKLRIHLMSLPSRNRKTRRVPKKRKPRRQAFTQSKKRSYQLLLRRSKDRRSSLSRKKNSKSRLNKYSGSSETQPTACWKSLKIRRNSIRMRSLGC